MCRHIEQCKRVEKERKNGEERRNRNKHRMNEWKCKQSPIDRRRIFKY